MAIFSRVQRRIADLLPATAGGAFPAIDQTHVDPSRPHRLAVSSEFLLRTLGGDYSQMTVDAAGRFHPLWADTRDGAWQVYTSAIHVVEPSLLGDRSAVTQAPGHAVSGADASTFENRKCSEDSSIAYIYGVPSWDKTRNEASIPVRLKNTSAATIFSPVRVMLTNSGHRASDPLDSNISITGAKAFNEIWPPVKIFDARGATLGDSATYTYPLDSDHP